MYEKYYFAIVRLCDWFRVSTFASDFNRYLFIRSYSQLEIPMSNTNFYVYEHIRKDTGAILYVGKGHDNRAYHPYKRNAYWKNVVNKANGFTVNFIAKNIDEELSLLCEMERIDQLKKLGIKLTNATNGGEGITGYRHTKEAKEKIGKYVSTRVGANNPNYGKKQSAETIAKRVEKMTGELHPMHGKKHSNEIKLKISKNRKGKLVGLDNPFFGKTHTKETKTKISEARKGRKASDETKAKMSESALALAYKHKNAKSIICITNNTNYKTINEASRQLNLHRQCIRMVCNGDLKQTGGYKFEWIKK